jgi:hypothetical protein
MEDSGHADWGAVVTGVHAVGGVVREVAVEDPAPRVVRGELQLVKVAGVDGLDGLADLWDSVAVFGHHDFVVSMQMHGVGLLGGVVNADPDPIALLDRDGSAGSVAGLAVDRVEGELLGHPRAEGLHQGAFLLPTKDLQGHVHVNVGFDGLMLLAG